MKFHLETKSTESMVIEMIKYWNDYITRKPRITCVSQNILKTSAVKIFLKMSELRQIAHICHFLKNRRRQLILNKDDALKTVRGIPVDFAHFQIVCMCEFAAGFHSCVLIIFQAVRHNFR